LGVSSPGFSLFGTTFFVAWWMWFFIGDFAEISCENVVSCVVKRGGSLVKSGHLQYIKPAAKMSRFFALFLPPGGETGVRCRS
jgi:hypothetical protein